MSGTVTQRDLVDSILGLNKVIIDLRRLTEGGLVKGVKEPSVPVSVQGLLGTASYLEEIAKELQSLIPDVEVTVPQ